MISPQSVSLSQFISHYLLQTNEEKETPNILGQNQAKEIMDEDMEDNTVIFTFTAVEIDLDYEFDAPRYFDFCREESLTEARNAEIWFQSAQTYPPSRKPQKNPNFSFILSFFIYVLGFYVP